MKREDFSHFEFFTLEEVEKTGADISRVKFKTMAAIDNARRMFGKPFHLLYNGMTSGKHTAKQHPNGEAIDFYVNGITPEEEVKLVIALAASGFHGIGIYRNKVGGVSIHADTREEIATWYGRKTIEQPKRTMYALTFKE